ncbi:CAP domain-containing protein [Conchiformibius steedae DSM 2580]|uniref:CAP domain-containing protein n=1 Tax=Conchiformibius steedae DSM 2580 TaxID=1121352 RepID=A0AAE9HWP1_9NEIS|nr:CAP domain-containing protein [Conchiformibius steedae]QMT33354.1 transferrin-binding protein-like solute binding protein [Conchiformibius steedae]URD67998.1 CAP domain-containing protein [Conchiformibius steedae DSM 2580]
MNARHSLMLGLLALLGLSACGSGGHDVVLSSSTMPSHLQPNNNKPQSKPNGNQPSNGNNNPFKPSQGSGGTGTANPSNPSNGSGTGTANPSNPSNGGGTGTTNPSNPSNGNGTGTANPSNPSNGSGADTANPSTPSNDSGTGTSTPSTPSAFQVTPPAAAQKAEIDKAVANTNKLRAEKGLPALQYDPNLSAYAQKRAEEIVKLFKHTRPDGESWSTGVKGGYSGENIAAGSATADKTVLDQWRNSSGHYANMINSNYTRIGIGLVYVPNSEHGYYWVQIFGSDSTTSDYHFISPNNMMRSALMIPVKRDALDALATLKIDGRTLPLTISGNSDWHTIKAQGYTGEFGGNTVFSRYGVVKAENEGQYRSFHQGLPTALADMPQAGVIRYQGQGIAAQGVEKRYLQADFTADFDRKTLNGSLSNAQQRFGIDAIIRGNTFVSPIGAKVATQGGFFGVNAAEVAGTFDDRQGTQGAFGATRR